MNVKRVKAPTFLSVPAGTKPAECRSCKATIYWITTASGKKMPVDVEVVGGYAPSDGGDGTQHDGSGVSHFATCEHAGQHRRPR